jgi:hypothetical protein
VTDASGATTAGARAIRRRRSSISIDSSSNNSKLLQHEPFFTVVHNSQ